MALAVTFPDGTIRQVPGQLKSVESQGMPERFVQIPVDCDLLWRFQRSDGAWCAVLRSMGPSQVTYLTPRQQEWWRAIGAMADDAPEPTSVAA